MSDPTFERTEVGKLSLQLFGLCDTCPQESRCEPMKTDCPVGLARRTLATFSNKNTRIIEDFDFEAVGTVPQAFDSKRPELLEVFRFISALCNRCMFHADKCFLNITFMLVERALHGEYRKRAGVRPVDIDAA